MFKKCPPIIQTLAYVASVSLGSISLSVSSSEETSVNLENWPNYIEQLDPYVDAAQWLPNQHKEDPQLRAELARFHYFVESMGFFGNFYQDTRYPDFWPVYNSAFPLGFNNPDDSYYMAVVDDDGVYKISGFRGTVRILEFEIGASTMQAYGRGEWAPSLSHYNVDRDGIHFDDNGYFEVILSPTRPEGYTGDWWQLKPNAHFILVRQRAYDWLNEEDGRLAIERLDVPAMKPRMPAEEIHKRISHEGEWVRNWTRNMSTWPKPLEESGLINRIGIFDLSQNTEIGVTGGLTTQKYLQGIFKLEDDEALILETELPETCKYWMFHLIDELMASIDQMNHQTSINGHQAVVDSDGKFRAVISARDPGVPNWLDTVGYKRGVMVGRWWECSSAPQPEITKVKVSEVRDYLPADTVVVTAEQRDAAIRLRRQGAQLRKRW
jgi:Protein of unknown function (DUF1214)